jgi:hypothetical protein
MTITDIMILLTIEDKDLLRNGASQMLSMEVGIDLFIFIHFGGW